MKVQLDPTPHQSTTGNENILQYGTQKMFELGSFKNRKAHGLKTRIFNLINVYMPFIIIKLKFIAEQP